MITNKDVRVENGNLILNGDKYPLDGQSPEAIMAIVEDNSDTTPTENSDAPITSGGVFTALAEKQDLLDISSGVITLNPNWSFDSNVTNIVEKMGNLAWISSYIHSDVALTADTVYEVGSLPVGFIPAKEHKCPMYQGSGTGALRGILHIRNNGKIEYRSLDGNVYAIYSTIVYPLN